ncbi:MAG: sodium/glutamate symporter [Bacillota bacterium]
MEMTLNLYQSMALAVAVFYLGAFLKSKIRVFRTYCIPVPVIGGILFAVANLILYQTNVLNLTIDTTLQSVFMTIFFTSVGFTAGFGMLKKGGKSLIIFLVAVALLICVQDVAGAALCKAFGLQPLLGLALGSMPLTGGHGTSTAFAPLLENLGISNAMTVSIAAATYGLVAGNVIGNPLARRRIEKLRLTSDNAASVDQEAMLELKKNTENDARLDVGRGTLGLALLFVAAGVGTLISLLFNKFHITLASYVGAMIVGIIIRNFCDRKHLDLPVKEIDTIGSISLNFFLALAMMGMKLYQLADLAVPMIVILLVQTVLTGLFIYYVTFNMLGRDYDAAVLASGHCGFGMGATPNAMANMDSLTKTYGPSEKAYLIIPVCGGFFTDIVNALLLTFFMNIL